MKYRSSFVALALMAGNAATSLAQPGTTAPVVTWVANQGMSTSLVSAWNSAGGLNNNGGWDVTLEINSPGGTVEVTVVSEDDEPIRDLLVDFNDETYDVELTVEGNTLARCASIHSIDMTGVSQTGHGDLIIFEIMCDQIIGDIRAHRIISIDVRKDIGQDQSNANTQAYTIELVTPTSGIAEIIDLLIGRNLFADITGNTASDEIVHIRSIDVDGYIGTSTYPVTIEANKLNNVFADNIYADITLDTTGTNGKVRRIQTRETFDFVGSLTMSEFHSSGGTGLPGLFIGGDLDANLNILDLNVTGEIVVTGVFATGNVINIDGDLAGDITLGNSGLVGQIIVNSADGGNVWSNASTVKVGSTILSPEPHYTQTGLGGGAVGEVAFDCHFEDCVPTATSSTPGILGSSSTNVAFYVKLTHYGPVTWTSGMPIQVLYCADSTECDPVDVTSDFQVTSAKEGRDMVVEPDGTTPAAGIYHLSPKSDVKCFGITATTPPSVVSYEYDLEFNMN